MKYLSYTQISMYLRCGWQYKERYIEGKIIPPGISLIKGKSTHRGIEHNFSQKIESHEDLKSKDIIDYSVNEYDQASKEEIFLTDEEKSKGKEDIIGAGRDSVANMSKLYADEAAPGIQPLKVEEKVYVNIPNSPSILSVIDCIDDRKNVRDFKTSSKLKNQKDIDNSLQLTIYSLSYEEIFGKSPNKLIFDILVDTKTPKYQILESQRNIGAYAQIYKIIQAVYEGISKGVFLPAAEGSWVCDPRYCGYYHTCKYKTNRIF